MYYRFKYKDKNRFSEWHRIRTAEFHRIEALVNQLRAGTVEVKDEASSPAQRRNRKFWHLEGRTLAVVSSMNTLLKEYQVLWPADWNYYRSLTWQQMTPVNKLYYFLDKLRTERKDNTKDGTGN